MTDEIKRAAEELALRMRTVIEIGGLEALGVKEALISTVEQALLAERRKAYEECADLVENKTIVFKGSWIGNDIREFREQIANEIRRRMEGV